MLLKYTASLLCAIVLFLPSCKKEYPNDIPQWLKNQIDICKKKKNDCKNLVVIEYECNGEIIYLLEKHDDIDNYIDYNGNTMCSALNSNFNDTCGFCPYANRIYKRTIWKE
jgi:hypothetical protein